MREPQHDVLVSHYHGFYPTDCAGDAGHRRPTQVLLQAPENGFFHVIANALFFGGVAVLLQAPENGFFHVIERRRGRLLSAAKFVSANWAEKVGLATAGSLVFQGLADHSFRAYRVSDGELLWSYALQNAIIAAPAPPTPLTVSSPLP